MRLIEAKRRGIIGSVSRELAALRGVGYRLSDSLCRQIVALAGEAQR
jgi:predicted nucleic acid-binding protein